MFIISKVDLALQNGFRMTMKFLYKFRIKSKFVLIDFLRVTVASPFFLPDKVSWKAVKM